MISKFNSQKTVKKPSVTELLSLLDKPALLHWANQQGLKGIDIKESRKKYLSDGVSIHKQIENFQTRNLPFEDSSVEELFKTFLSDKEVLDLEKNIETEYFIGRYDSRIKYNGVEYIIDYKSNQKNIYLENKLQLVAYAMAEPCDKFAIVSVPDFTFIEVVIDDTKPYEDILKSLSIIYKSKLLIQ
jgi:hypothetical protein